jgi:hypothetical protein
MEHEGTGTARPTDVVRERIESPGVKEETFIVDLSCGFCNTKKGQVYGYSDIQAGAFWERAVRDRCNVCGNGWNWVVDEDKIVAMLRGQ